MSGDVHAGFCERRRVRLPPATHPIVHCRSRRQAEYVQARLEQRMREVGLRLHPEKTKVVYCKDHMRQEQHEHASFTFLGFTFRQRNAKWPNGQHYSWFLPAISAEALKAKSMVLRKLRIHLHTRQSLSDLARWLNPIIAGWSGSTARRRVSLAADGLLAAARRTGHAHS